MPPFSLTIKFCRFSYHYSLLIRKTPMKGLPLIRIDFISVSPDKNHKTEKDLWLQKTIPPKKKNTAMTT